MGSVQRTAPRVAEAPADRAKDEASGLDRARELESRNPASPRDLVGVATMTTETDLAEAVSAAHRAAIDWGATVPAERGAILRRAAANLSDREDELAALLTREEGKTLPEALGEIRRAIDTLHYHAAQAWTASGEHFNSSAPDEGIYTRRVPLGVVGVLTPWNFPIAIPAWKIAPALVYGNTVVWKPSSETPLIAIELARALTDAGLPTGALNLVSGPGALGSALADADLDGISFTGSAAVGREIWRNATNRGVKVQMELGGHNPAIVHDDADLELAAEHVVAGAMLSTGQKCTCTRRVIAAAGVHDELLERVVARVDELEVGNGLSPDTDVGPLISARARDDVAAAVRRAADSGAEIACGGTPLDDESLEGGHFFAPTVLTGVDAKMEIAQEEVFGPVVSMLRFQGDDEAIELANGTEYGLSAAVFTRSRRRVEGALQRVEAGLIHVNHQTTGSEIHVPFAGLKGSSGQAPAEQGLSARDFYTETKTVYDRPGE